MDKRKEAIDLLAMALAKSESHTTGTALMDTIEARKIADAILEAVSERLQAEEEAK